MSTIEEATTLWKKICEVKKAKLEAWQPEPNFFSTAALTDIMGFTAMIENAMAKVFDDDEVYRIEADLAVLVGSMKYPVFKDWKRSEPTRVREAATEISDIATAKLSTIMGI